MKQVSVLLMLSFFYFSANAEDWKLVKKQGVIELYSRTAECNDNVNGIYKNLELLKWVNTSNKETTISFSRQLWYNNTCINCGLNSDEQRFEIVLKPNETIEGSCANKDKRLTLFKEFSKNSSKKLTHFEFTISIK
jgi:hypothetical protein